MLHAALRVFDHLLSEIISVIWSPLLKRVTLRLPAIHIFVPIWNIGYWFPSMSAVIPTSDIINFLEVAISLSIFVGCVSFTGT